jgi:hypothetical protein
VLLVVAALLLTGAARALAEDPPPRQVVVGSLKPDDTNEYEEEFWLTAGAFRQKFKGKFKAGANDDGDLQKKVPKLVALLTGKDIDGKNSEFTVEAKKDGDNYTGEITITDNHHAAGKKKKVDCWVTGATNRVEFVGQKALSGGGFGNDEFEILPVNPDDWLSGSDFLGNPGMLMLQTDLGTASTFTAGKTAGQALRDLIAEADPFLHGEFDPLTWRYAYTMTPVVGFANLHVEDRLGYYASGVVPEPASLMLLALGGLVFARRRAA